MTSTHSPRRRALVSGAALAACAVALAVGATASAVSVRGSLQVPRDYTPPQPQEGPAQYYWQEWNGVLDPRPQRLDVTRQLTVVLLGEADNRPEPFVKLAGGALSPSTIVAQAGSTLRIQNTDGAAHELFSDDLDGFSPLQTAPGNARTIRLPAAPGHHVIRDRLYPHVVGHLHVVGNLAARAQPDSGGRFSLDDVAPGTYTLKAYFEDREVATQEVTVEGRDLTVDPLSLNLSAASQ